jgi:hypothetical protein
MFPWMDLTKNAKWMTQTKRSSTTDKDALCDHARSGKKRSYHCAALQYALYYGQADVTISRVLFKTRAARSHFHRDLYKTHNIVPDMSNGLRIIKLFTKVVNLIST